MSNSASGDREHPAIKARQLTVLTLRYLDGLITPEEMRALNAALAAHAPCRDLFVHLCRLHGELAEALAPRRAAAAGWGEPALPRSAPPLPEDGQPHADERPVLVLDDPDGPEGGAALGAQPDAARPAVEEAGSETLRIRQATQETNPTIPVVPTLTGEAPPDSRTHGRREAPPRTSSD